MLNTVIRDFVDAQIKKKTGQETVTDEEIRQWLSDMSEKAQQRKFVTHIPKTVHPGAQVTNILVKSERENDGYIRTANLPEFLDTVGNATFLPISGLLNLFVDDRLFYQHLRDDTNVSKEFVDFIGLDGETVRDNYLKTFLSDDTSVTDGKMRQVYFPVDDSDYYVITPLMSSTVMHAFKAALEKNDKYNSNPLDLPNKLSARQLEARGQYLEGGYWNLPNLVTVSYGGDKPQNISSDNLLSKERKLIKSLPPEIRKRKIRIPLTSFFKESVYSKAGRYVEIFSALDKIYKCPRNNIDIRSKRDDYMLALLEEIAVDIAAVRYEISFGDSEYRGSLDSAEYTMLYEDDKRYESDEWLEKIAEKFTRWFFDTYKKIVKKPFEYGVAEFQFVKDFSVDNRGIFVV